MSTKLEGKVCVVTGASSGIGRRTAVDLAAEGARVCLVARREEGLRAVLEELGGEQEGHSIALADVADRAQVQALADHVRSVHGGVDALINNAGFSAERPIHEPGAVEDITRLMATNFFGAVYCTAALLPMLRAAAPSSVVNVASVAGRLPVGAVPGYCSSKFALVGWSEAVHSQLRPLGVYVSTVEPGPIPTEGFPQTSAIGHPVMRYALGGVDDVSAAIRHAIQHHDLRRTVPRWYYLLQFPRLLAPSLFRAVQQFAVGSRRDPRSEKLEI